MFNPDADVSPINPLPKSVILLLCLVAGVEVVLQLGARGMIGGPTAIGWRLDWARSFGFYDPAFEWMRANASYPMEHMIRFVSYAFIHSNFTHIIFVLLFIAVFGKFVAELCGDIAVLTIFIASAVFGALTYGLVFNEDFLLLGAYPAVYGLLGAFTWVQFQIRRSEGESGARAFQLIGFFMALQLVYRVFFVNTNDWLADLAGFAMGFGLAVLFAPGGVVIIKNALKTLRSR